MTKNEEEKLKYLDIILTAIKNESDNISFSELINIIENDNKSEIIKTLISGASPFTEKSLVYLNNNGFIKISNPINKDDYKKVSLTFEGELIQSQGGMLADAKKKENQIKRQSLFHRLMPWIAGISMLISIVALSRTFYSNSDRKLNQDNKEQIKKQKVKQEVKSLKDTIKKTELHKVDSIIEN